MARRAQTTEDQPAKSLLDIELERIEKDYGKGTIIAGGRKYEGGVVSTGSLKLDYATGIWGLPFGKLVEFLGWESSGKSTITQSLIGNCQAKGLKALLVDGENSFDTIYAKALGVDVDSLLIEQLDEGGGEKCFNVAERLIRTKGVGIVVIDSQTSMLTKKEMLGETGDSAIGLRSRMMSQAVPKIMNAAAYANCLVIFVSQFREKIGVMFGSPETTSGGNALKFYAHMRIDFRKSVLREGGTTGDAYGNETRCKIIKNKCAPPYKEAKFKIIFGEGVDTLGEIIDLGIDTGIIEKSGSWYSYLGNQIGQGEDKVAIMLNDNPDLLIEIKEKVIKKLTDEKNTPKEVQQTNEEILLNEDSETIRSSQEDTEKEGVL